MKPPDSDRPKSALVLGLGTSGEAAAHLLLDGGSRVTVADAAASAAVRARAEGLERRGARVRLGDGRLPDGAFALCVVSPGIAPGSAWLREVEARAIPVLSELELGWRGCAGRVLAITGSNGKSTAVKLCAEALARAGRRVVAGGNCGPPLSAVARQRPPPDWVVAEVSSFQLEHVDRFRPDVGVVLNLYPNHLDRHGDMAAYARLKARLLAGMDRGGTGIAFEELPAAFWDRLPGTRPWVTFGTSDDADFRYRPGRVVDRRGGREIPVNGTIFDHPVLGLTAAAAVAALAACEADPQHVSAAARAFEPLPHRLQPVAVIGGVRFVDDSKATNLAALAAAVRTAGGPVRLIAGGLLKETDLAWVKKTLFKNVRGIYIIGRCAEAMRAAWTDAAPCCVCEDLEKAVGRAWKEAEPGDVVLLSPGCASFDQFQGFEERGERFAQMVRGLKERGRS